MSRPLVLAPLVLLACQEVIIAKDTRPPIDPIDTDAGAGALQPDIELTPATLRFASLPPGCESPPQEVRIENVGTADLRLKSVELRGSQTGAFRLQRPAVNVLAPGESTTASVVFVPEQLGPVQDARILVESNDPDEEKVRVGFDAESTPVAFVEEVFVQDEQSDVDVLWTIDASGSMGEEIAELKQKFDQFIQTFTNLGLNYRVAAVPADAAASCAVIPTWIEPSTVDGVAQFNATVDKIFGGQAPFTGCYGEAGFGAAKSAVTNNPSFIRPSASLAVIAVSDEPEQSGISPQNFASWLIGVKGDPGRVSFSGFVGPASGGGFLGNACPRGSHPNADAEAAPQYHAAIRLTGGVWGDLCKFDIGPFLVHVSYVAAGMNVGFPLGTTPVSASPSAVTVEVDGRVVPWGVPDGWTYDGTTNAIVFHGTEIPSPGSVITVRYPFEADCAP